MGRRKGKGKKHRQKAEEQNLDEKYGKKQELYLVNTAAGPIYVPEGERVAVRVHNRITSIPVERLTKDMHVLFWKQVLSNLTLGDVHNDLMAATFSPRAQELAHRLIWEELPENERRKLNAELEKQIRSELPAKGKAVIGSSRYRAAHNLLHDHPAEGTGLPQDAEIPVLRRLLFQHVKSGDAEFVPDEIRRNGDFYEKLFKVGGKDFSGKTYSQMTNWMRDKAAMQMFGKHLYELKGHEAKQLPSPSLLNSWLKGEVTMPVKQQYLKALAEATGNSELAELAELKGAGRFWAGRRSSLMAYVKGLRGEGTGKSGKWSSGSHLTELEAILNKRIHEIREKTVTVGVNGISTVTARPGELEKSPEHRRRAKLSRNIVKAPADPGEFEEELGKLGMDTDGLAVSTWEEDRKLRNKASQRDKLRKEHEKLVEDAWKKSGDFFGLPEREKRRMAKKLEAGKRRAAEEERLREKKRKKLEMAKWLDEFQDKNAGRMSTEEKLYTALRDAATSREHGFGKVAGDSTRIQLIDFLGEYGPDKDRFKRDKGIEVQLAWDVVDGKVTELSDYAKRLLDEGHSHTNYYKRLWESSPALQRKPLEQFLSLFHSYDFENYQGARDDLYKRTLPKDREATRKRMQHSMDLLTSEELAMFNYLTKSHPRLVERLHAQEQELPVKLRPFSYTRFLEHDKKRKVPAGALWGRGARGYYERAMGEEGIPLQFGYGLKKKGKKKRRR